MAKSIATPSVNLTLGAAHKFHKAKGGEFRKAKGGGRGFRNHENCLTFLSKFPYKRGGSGVKKSQKLPYVISERPLTLEKRVQ